MLRRPNFLLRIACVLCVFAVFHSGIAAESNAPRRYSSLDAQDKQRLEKQRVLIGGIVRQRYGVALTGNEEDIPVLQRLVDDKAFAKTQTEELNALGVAFGDVIAKDNGLDWVMFEGEQGKEATLRYRNTSLQVNAVSMVAKRIEEGKVVNLPAMRAALREHIGNVVKTKGLK